MVLSILAAGESYGYEILQRIVVLSDGRWEWSDGMLYPVLHRLEKARLIRSRWEVAESGRRRKYYRITAKGRKTLERDRANWLAVYGALSKTWALNNV